MTAILVLLTIIVAVAVDVALVRLRRRVAAPQLQGLEAMQEPMVPAVLFLAPSHTWAHVSSDGVVRVGIDDFLAQAVGTVDGIRMPAPGTKVRAGEPLFWLQLGSRELPVPSPLIGEVMGANQAVKEKPYLLTRDPYGVGWSVSLWAHDLLEGLEKLRLGAAALGFLRQEMRAFMEFSPLSHSPQGAPLLADGGLPVRGVLRQLPEPLVEAFHRLFVERKEA